MKKELIFNVNKLVDSADSLLKQENTTRFVRKELSEIYLSLSLLNKNFNIDPLSKASLEYLMNRIVQKICYEGFFGYYMGFYYLPAKVYNKQADELSNEITLANINITCFRCLIDASDMLNFSLETSTNDYFFSRGDRVAGAIKNFISYPFDFDISSMIYLALNYYQTLCEYENCADTTYNEQVPELKQIYEDLFNSMINDDKFLSTLQHNKQLLSFWISVLPQNLKLDFELGDFPQTINNRHRWVLYSYFSIDNEKANSYFESIYEQIVSQPIYDIIGASLIVRIICYSLLKKDDIDISDYELHNVQIDNSNRIQKPLSFFFKNYNELHEQNCTNEDLDTLMSLDDSVLRHKVAACMQNVDKNELERQISKPHGTLEISDLDIKFFEDGNPKYLCMPFKTGREISKKSLDESYIYQLLKPFSHFGNSCFVVLITAKKCSQGLETYIERMSIREPSWRIEVIQHEQLCKLLKANHQI